MDKLRLQLIANPVAGRQAGPLIARAERRFQEAGARVTLCLTSRRGDAERLAAQGDYDRIVVAGGDGTVNEVLNGLRPDSPPLAVLAIGTTNVLALEAGLPKNFDRACDLALTGAPTPIRLGLAGERRFALMAGVGFDAAVVRDVDLDLKRRLGKGAYLLGALRGWLGYQGGGRLWVEEENGQTRVGYGLIVGKARCYGGRFSLTPGASLFRDDLEVLLLRLPGRLTLVMAGLALLTGRPLARPWGESFRTRWIAARGEGLPVQIDGDPAGVLPRSFSMNPFPVRLLLPPGR